MGRVAAPDTPNGELDALLARIAAMTATLREAPLDGGAPTLERELVADLKRVAALLRADITSTGESLARLFDSTRPDTKSDHQQSS
jgi:hypothetical protein